METNTEDQRSLVDRSARIRFLRKLILTSVVASCLIPTCICILLAIRYDRQKSRLEKATDELRWYEQHYGESALADADTDNPIEHSDVTLVAAEEMQAEAETAENTDIPEEAVAETGEASDEQTAPGAPAEPETETGETDSEEWDGTRRVYITFDDGPSSSTAEILDILDSYGVKATFFVTGKEDSRYADIYKRIAEEGHTIGMHSYSHRYSELYESLDSFQEDLHKLQTFLYETTGVWSEYYRFPGGSSNTVSKVDMSKLIDYLGKEQITYFDWNVASSDDRSGVTKDVIVANVMTGVPKFPEEAIILLHDASDKRATVEALPEIIEQVQAMDNTVIVPITEDTLPVQHISNMQ